MNLFSKPAPPPQAIAVPAGGASGSYTITTNNTAGMGVGGGPIWQSNGNIGQHTTISANDIIVNGKSLTETLDAINERLSILVPDPAKLEKYEALKECYKQYKLLEALLK